jgi:hypothetical protein
VISNKLNTTITHLADTNYWTPLNKHSKINQAATATKIQQVEKKDRKTARNKTTAAQGKHNN